jgi:four helix bundle protein
LGVAAEAGSGSGSLNPSSTSTSTTATSSSSPVLPHHRLVAYSVARDFLVADLACRIRDPKLRDEAHRSAKSACLNCAEGAGRVSPADKARAFAIARAETVEAAAAVEIAALCGDAAAAPAGEVARLADRLVALTGLVGWRR